MAKRICNNQLQRNIRVASQAMVEVRTGCNLVMAGRPAFPSPFAYPATLPTGMRLLATHEDAASTRAGRLADVAGNPTGLAIFAGSAILSRWPQITTQAYSLNREKRLTYPQPLHNWLPKR